MNEEMSKEEKKWFGTLLSYAKGSGGRLGASVVFSMISLLSGIIPYYCVYRILDLYIGGTLEKDFVKIHCPFLNLHLSKHFLDNKNMDAFRFEYHIPM